MYMNKNALRFDNLTADEMNILLSELKDRFPDIAVAAPRGELIDKNRKAH